MNSQVDPVVADRQSTSMCHRRCRRVCGDGVPTCVSDVCVCLRTVRCVQCVVCSACECECDRQGPASVCEQGVAEARDGNYTHPPYSPGGRKDKSSSRNVGQ